MKLNPIAVDAAKLFCVYTKQEHSTEERLAQIISIAISEATDPLATRLRELEADKRRIDQLEDLYEHSPHAAFCYSPEDEKFFIWADGHNPPHVSATTIRAVIDNFAAARTRAATPKGAGSDEQA